MKIQSEISHYINALKIRLAYGAILMALTVFGIPFIPFVPVAMLFGFWDLDKNTHGSGAIGEMISSVAFTFVIGIVIYVLALIELILKY